MMIPVWLMILLVLGGLLIGLLPVIVRKRKVPTIRERRGTGIDGIESRQRRRLKRKGFRDGRKKDYFHKSTKTGYYLAHQLAAGGGEFNEFEQVEATKLRGEINSFHAIKSTSVGLIDKQIQDYDAKRDKILSEYIEEVNLATNEINDITAELTNSTLDPQLRSDKELDKRLATQWKTIAEKKMEQRKIELEQAIDTEIAKLCKSHDKIIHKLRMFECEYQADKQQVINELNVYWTSAAEKKKDLGLLPDEDSMNIDYTIPKIEFGFNIDPGFGSLLIQEWSSKHALRR